MGFFELFTIAVALAMDAFAVSVCKGLSTDKLKARHYLLIGLWFGGFQAAMPALGYLLGSTFESYITAIDHWIAFILLALIGANMIREALGGDDESVTPSFAVGAMLPLAIATSIDALAVGITFALLPDVNIFVAVGSIGVTTFLISAAGLRIGNIFGAKFKKPAEIVGGAILILMGVKILIEHLM